MDKLKKNSNLFKNVSNMNSPCLLPPYLFEEKSFSTKKERQTPRERPPPTPRVRMSLMGITFETEKPQSISFLEVDSKLSSKFYDANLKELYFKQCFDVICKLGSGSFGEVYKVRCKEDGKYYAVKRSKERFRGISDRRRKLEEVRKHEQLSKHQNCVQFYKAWEEKGFLYIQTELCKTSLSQYSEENHDIPEALVWNYLVDLLLAVEHIHKHDLIHLDIKPDNIFVTENGICKLGDFGLVLDVSKGEVHDGSEGDVKYLAPEVLEGPLTKAADIFSLGITILELASDLDLPSGSTAWHLLREGKIPKLFIQCLSPALAQVICQMMHPNYEERPSVSDILQMPAVAKARKKRILNHRFGKVGNYISQPFKWLLGVILLLKYFLCWPFKRNPVICPVTPSTPRQKLFADLSHSFSDDEVHKLEDSSSEPTDEDLNHMKSLKIPFKEFLKSGLVHSRNSNAVSTPPSFQCWEADLLNSSVSPSFRTSNNANCCSSSPKSESHCAKMKLDFDNLTDAPRNTSDNRISTCSPKSRSLRRNSRRSFLQDSKNITPKNLFNTFSELSD